jgi:hypothetical protein
MTQPSPGYNTPIPASITTPDRVETRLGTLEFFDGLPKPATARLLHDHLKFIRGVEAFLNGVPAASIEAMRRGMIEMGGVTSHHCVMFDQLLDSKPLFLTGNTDTVYASVILDLKHDGPTVVEIPTGCGPGTVNDAWFRFVIDMGGPGPDRGQGGKYLILPPDHDGIVPDGYFTASSPSYTNWLILRGFLVDGRPDAAAAMFRDGLKVYPLAASDDPPAMEFISASGHSFNTIHANDATFYEEVHSVIDREHIDVIDLETRGLLASIGIRKGHPFAPDENLAGILRDAAAVGNATARTLFFQPEDPEAYIYGDESHWKTGFVGGDYQWLIDDGEGGRNLDARTYFFYMATVNTPAMALKMDERLRAGPDATHHPAVHREVAELHQHHGQRGVEGMSPVVDGMDAVDESGGAVAGGGGQPDVHGARPLSHVSHAVTDLVGRAEPKVLRVLERRPRVCWNIRVPFADRSVSGARGVRVEPVRQRERPLPRESWRRERLV